MNKTIEEQIVDKYITVGFVNDVYNELTTEVRESGHALPALIKETYESMLFHFIDDAIVRYKNPTINFSTVQHFVAVKVKEMRPDLIKHKEK